MIVIYVPSAPLSATKKILAGLNIENITGGVSPEEFAAIKELPKNLQESARKKLLIRALRSVKGADGFIGLSSTNSYFVGYEEKLFKFFANGAFCFAGANPGPEVDPNNLKTLMSNGALDNLLFIGVGRFGDTGITTLNNSTAFPGISRPLLDYVKSNRRLTNFDPDLLAAKAALAISEMPLTGADYPNDNLVLPKTFLDTDFNFSVVACVAGTISKVISSEGESVDYTNLAEELSLEHQRQLKTARQNSPSADNFLRLLETESAASNQLPAITPQQKIPIQSL
jgi:malic enzyme